MSNSSDDGEPFQPEMDWREYRRWARAYDRRWSLAMTFAGWIAFVVALIVLGVIAWQLWPLLTFWTHR